MSVFHESRLLSAIIYSLAFVFLTSFFLIESVSIDSFYLLVIAGMVMMLVNRPVHSANYQRWITISLSVLIVVVLSYIQYRLSDTQQDYFASPSIKFLWLIPGILMFPWLDKEETLLQVAIVLFLATALLSHWINGASVFGDEIIESRYAKLLALMPMIFLFKSVRKRPDWIWMLFACGAAVAGIAAVINIWFYDLTIHWSLDHFDSRSRAAGNSSAVIFGGICLSMTIVTVVGLYKKWRGWRAAVLFVFLLLSAMLGSLAVITSGSRGIWLAIPPVMLLALYFYQRTFHVKYRWAGLAVLLILISASYKIPIVNSRISLAMHEMQDYLQNATSNDQVSSTAVGVRFEMWKAAWLMVKTHPLYGIGPGNFNTEAKKLVKSGHWQKNIANFDHPHNQYLAALSGMGIPGLIFFSGILLIPAWMFYRRIKASDAASFRPALAGLLLIGAYTIFGLTVAPFERKEHILFYTFSVAILLSAARQKADGEKSDKSEVRINQGVSALNSLESE